jgi:choline-glycine betaine transporter
LTSTTGALLASGGMEALKSVMIIGALPFSLVMALMSVALIKSLIFRKID